jgi:tRNA-dihydrouridine synthase B
MDIAGRAMLAPMSTFTNLPFRLLCQRHGCQGATVPLVSAKALIMHNGKNDELDPDPSERFVGVQIFGASADDIGKAARLVAKRFDFIRYIDINCACPVKKVVRNGAGSALLRKPVLVAQMLKAAAECGIPVTVKLRKSAPEERTLGFCRACEDAGASALFMHGRLPGQGYSGEADWEAIARMAKEVSVPVIGSGDIRGMEQGRLLAAKSGCAGFMVGRAAMADPAIFSSPQGAEPERKRSLFLEYLSLCEEFGMKRFPDLKSKAIQIFSGFKDSAGMRRALCGCSDEGELMKAVGARA